MRRIALIVLVLLAVPILAGCGEAGPGTSRSDAAAAFWDTNKALSQLDYDVQDVLLHARLRTPAELAEQLRELAHRGREESQSLAPFRLPYAFGWRRDALREALAEQVATLRRTATAARAAGPPAAARASARLLRQSGRIAAARARYNLVLQSGG